MRKRKPPRTANLAYLCACSSHPFPTPVSHKLLESPPFLHLLYIAPSLTRKPHPQRVQTSLSAPLRAALALLAYPALARAFPNLSPPQFRKKLCALSRLRLASNSLESRRCMGTMRCHLSQAHVSYETAVSNARSLCLFPPSRVPAPCARFRDARFRHVIWQDRYYPQFRTRFAHAFEDPVYSPPPPPPPPPRAS